MSELGAQLGHYAFDFFNPLPDLPLRHGKIRRVIEEMLKFAE